MKNLQGILLFAQIYGGVLGLHKNVTFLFAHFSLYSFFCEFYSCVCRFTERCCCSLIYNTFVSIKTLIYVLTLVCNSPPPENMLLELWEREREREREREHWRDYMYGVKWKSVRLHTVCIGILWNKSHIFKYSRHSRHICFNQNQMTHLFIWNKRIRITTLVRAFVH